VTRYDVMPTNSTKKSSTKFKPSRLAQGLKLNKVHVIPFFCNSFSSLAKGYPLCTLSAFTFQLNHYFPASILHLTSPASNSPTLSLNTPFQHSANQNNRICQKSMHITQQPTCIEISKMSFNNQDPSTRSGRERHLGSLDLALDE